MKRPSEIAAMGPWGIVAWIYGLPVAGLLATG